MIVAKGMNSIECIVDDSKNVSIVRAGDCEHVTIFIDNRVFSITSFINSCGEPQCCIDEVRPIEIPKFENQVEEDIWLHENEALVNREFIKPRTYGDNSAGAPR